jgi:patatin-like phospholipase/acyl hydrolase
MGDLDGGFVSTNPHLTAVSVLDSNTAHFFGNVWLHLGGVKITVLSRQQCSATLAIVNLLSTHEFSPLRRCRPNRSQNVYSLARPQTESCRNATTLKRLPMSTVRAKQFRGLRFVRQHRREQPHSVATEVTALAKADGAHARTSAGWPNGFNDKPKISQDDDEMLHSELYAVNPVGNPGLHVLLFA